MGLGAAIRADTLKQIRFDARGLSHPKQKAMYGFRRPLFSNGTAATKIMLAL
jgi:hypothetical protein